MTDKQDVIVSLLKEIDKNIENLGGSETDVLLSNRITTLENSVKTINTDINGIKTTNTTQTTNITDNTNKINTANLNITNLTNELSTVKNNVSTNTSNIGTLTTDVNTLKTTSATKTELNTTNTSLNTTNTNVSNLTTRVTNVENKATTNESNINTLNERVTTLENAEPSGGGSGTTSGGYPVVTVEDDFNITAEPNTFYNIKNYADSEVSINFNPELFYNTGTDKILLFTFDDVNDITSLCLDVSEYIGVVFKKDTSKEGYKYKSVMDLSSKGYGTVIIYAKSYPTSGEDLEVCISNDVVGLDNFEITLTNVVVLNEHIDTIIQLNALGTQIYALCIKEVENDSVKFKHKYLAYVAGGNCYVYTLEPYPNCSTVYTKLFGNSEPDYEDATDVKIYKNPVEISDHINEFVFNINAPTNIIFNQTIKWHNYNIPDLTEEGVYTISIVNGVGCYTFVNN